MTNEPRSERIPFMCEPTLVRDLDDAAKHLGISRSELIRRTLADDAGIRENARRRRDGFTPVSRPADPDGAQLAQRWVGEYERDHAADLERERASHRATAGLSDRAYQVERVSADGPREAAGLIRF